MQEFEVPVLPEEHAENKEHSFNINSLFGFLGLSALISWILSIFFYQHSPLTVFAYPSVLHEFLFPVFGVGVFLCLLIGSTAADIFNTPGRLRLVGVVALAFLVLSWVVPYELVQLIGLTLAYSGLSLLWAVYLGNRRHIVYYIGGALIVGGALCLLVTTMLAAGARVLSIALPLASLVLFMLVSPSLFKQWEFVSKVQSKKRWSAAMSGLITTFIDGVLLGVAVFCITQTADYWQINSLIIGSVFIISGVALVLDVKYRMLVSEAFLLKTYAIRILPCFFFLAYLQGFWINLIGCYLILNLSFHLTYVNAANAEQTRFNQLSSIYTFGRSRALVFFGFVLGWVVIYSIFVVNQTDIVRVVVCFVLLMILSILNIFVFKDNYPTQEREMELRVSGELSTNTGAWRRKLEQTAKEFQLSPRQTDVFYLLARGRNAEYIQKQFFISKATAKAHIYSIYRKTGIHSQQDLIDLIENRDKRGKKEKNA
jgi:DNA-binding CsgD family transcriptional regulator